VSYVGEGSSHLERGGDREVAEPGHERARDAEERVDRRHDRGVACRPVGVDDDFDRHQAV
jgi:hypothetical protein